MLQTISDMRITDFKPTGDSGLVVWLLVTYKPGEICKMELAGTERLEGSKISPGEVYMAFSKRLRPDCTCFVLHRSFFIPPQFASVPFPKNLRYIKSRFGLVLWQGMEISLMAKALSSFHWKEWTEIVKQKLDGAPFDGHIRAREIQEVTEAALRARLR
eukprot:gb/GEZN01019766.1/.p2 GENE.gb/GEZN01019766.1/~~gb/GEZN01019766.1/.p2  ORF type:complete len:159 (+),score=19.39 gb/GEZN01019766.1/:181-657(+)